MRWLTPGSCSSTRGTLSPSMLAIFLAVPSFGKTFGPISSDAWARLRSCWLLPLLSDPAPHERLLRGCLRSGRQGGQFRWFLTRPKSPLISRRWIARELPGLGFVTSAPPPQDQRRRWHSRGWFRAALLHPTVPLRLGLPSTPPLEHDNHERCGPPLGMRSVSPRVAFTARPSCG